MNAALRGLETHLRRPSLGWFALALLLLICIYLLWVTFLYEARPTHDLNSTAFSRDLAAHQLVSEFAGKGARINRDLLAGYESRLVRHFPTASIVDAGNIPVAGNVILLEIAEASLHDPEIGVVANADQRGLDWERAGSVSFYRDGEQVFQSRVGVRVHGGDWARGEKRGLGFRLYFRAAYDSDNLSASLVWPHVKGRLERLVVLGKRDDFRNAIGFDISRRLGLPTPYGELAKFYLNGVDQGVHLVSEHLSEQFLRSRFGNGEFDHFQWSDNWNNCLCPLHPPPRQLLDKPGGNGSKYEIAEVSRRIDFEALLDQYLLHLLLEVYDGFQDLIVRDLRSPDTKWFFVTWDLEGGFAVPWGPSNFQKYNPEEPKEYFAHLGTEQSVYAPQQGKIWRDLQNDDEFRRAFVVEAMDALNHRVTERWVDRLIERYEEQAEQYEIVGGARYTMGGQQQFIGLDEIRTFLQDNRRKIVSQVAERWGYAPVHSVEVIGRKGMELIVDGYLEGTRYRGQYLDGSELVIRLRDKDGERHAVHWEINGRQQTRPEQSLIITVDRNTKVQAIVP